MTSAEESGADPLFIESARLIVRPITGADAAALHAYRRLEDVTRHLAHDPLDLDQARARIDDSVRDAAEAPPGWFHQNWVFTLRSDPATVVGDGRLWNFRSAPSASDGPLASPDLDDPQELSLGYALHPEHQGRGYAFEAAATLIEWAHGHTAATRIVANAHDANIASQRLLRKLGFRDTESFAGDANGPAWTRFELALRDNQ